MKKREKNILWGVLIIYLGLLVYATFNDLEIFKSLTVVGNPIGTFFEKIASIPHAFILLFSSSIALGTTKIEKSFKSIFFILLNGLYFILAAAFSILLTQAYVPKVIPIVMIAAAIYIAFSISKINDTETIMRWKKIAWVAGLTFLFSTLIIETTKIKVGRVRPRSLLSDYSNFSPWYSVNGMKYLDTIQTTTRPAEELKSVPSGHSQWASIVFVFSMLPYTLKSLEGKRFTIILFALAWAAINMFARVWVGAHFTTDTLIGAGITIAVFLITHRIIIKESYH